MENLNLVLKHRWFDMIARGIKKEEYREIKRYYMGRLCSSFHHAASCSENCTICKNFTPRQINTVTLHRAYTSNVITFEVREIVIGYGFLDWGAPFGVKVFKISLGRRIS